MSDVDKELDNVEEDLELENQEQEELQDDAGHQDDGQEDAPEAEEDVVEEVDSAEEDEEPKPPSRREQLRIQNLLQKMKEEESLPKKTQSAADDVLNYEDELDADEPVIQKLKTDRDSFGEKQYQKGVEEAYRFSRFETRLEVDAPRVESKYTQLDKNSDDFNPVLADTINRMYLSFVGFDGKSRSVRTADVRYADYVDSVYELADEIASNKVETVTTNLKKQASKTGVRPGGSAPKRINLNKAPQDMTDEELEAAIKANMPTRR